MIVLSKADEEAARRLKVIRGADKAASARNALKEARIEVRDLVTFLIHIHNSPYPDDLVLLLIAVVEEEEDCSSPESLHCRHQRTLGDPRDEPSRLPPRF